jgi:hypothetical protein
MPSSTYAVTTGNSSGFSIAVIAKTANGFQLTAVDGTSLADTSAFFQVSAIDASPPKGGTGTDSWASVAADGTLGSSFNIALIEKTGIGGYKATFTTAMPTADYAVTGSALVTSAGQVFTFVAYNKTTTGFQWATNKDNGTTNPFEDCAASFTVNATNAMLPASFTVAEIQSVLDFIALANPAGIARAWGSVSSTGNLVEGLNIASTSKISTGLYQITFATPMPRAQYAVTSTSGGGYGLTKFENKTVAGFQMKTYNRANPIDVSDNSFDFTVHSNL